MPRDCDRDDWLVESDESRVGVTDPHRKEPHHGDTEEELSVTRGSCVDGENVC